MQHIFPFPKGVITFWKQRYHRLSGLTWCRVHLRFAHMLSTVSSMLLARQLIRHHLLQFPCFLHRNCVPSFRVTWSFACTRAFSNALGRWKLKLKVKSSPNHFHSLACPICFVRKGPCLAVHAVPVKHFCCLSVAKDLKARSRSIRIIQSEVLPCSHQQTFFFKEMHGHSLGHTKAIKLGNK